MKKKRLFFMLFISFIMLSFPVFSQSVKTYSLTVDVVGKTSLWCGSVVEIDPPGQWVSTDSVFDYDEGTEVQLKLVAGTPRPTTAPGEDYQTITINGSTSPLILTMDEDKFVTIEYTTHYYIPPETPAPEQPLYTLHLNVLDGEAAEEGLDTARISIEEEFTGDIQGDGWIEVLYTISGTATNGVDYEELNNVVWVLLGSDIGGPTPEPGADTNIITITPIDDTNIEATETVIISLSGYNESATITIADNEEIMPYTTGDVNNDNAIDIIDALLIAQYYVGIDPVGFDATHSAGDVNCDGFTDIIDALLVAQYYVGIKSELC